MEQTKENKTNNILKKEITKKDILEFFKNNWLNIYIIINILYIFIGSFLVRNYNMFFSDFSTGYFRLFILNVVVIIILFLVKKYKKDISHIFMALAIIFGVISVIFAKNQHVALVGFMDRWEGLLVILYYITIMFLSSFVDNKYKKTIIYFILASGLIQTIIGILQVYNVPNIPKTRHNSATGFIQNPNFFGSYIILNIGYAIGLYIEEKSAKKQITYILLIAIFMIGLLISNTMSAVVGLAFIMIFALVYCVKNKIISKFFITLTIIICSTVLVTALGKTNLLKDTYKTMQDAAELANGNAEDGLGSGRMLIWKKCIKVAPKYLLHGVGVDNFYYAFEEEGGPEGFDKAHNEYLQLLITQGIFCLITYLTLYMIILKRGIKNSFKNQNIYLVLPVIGYLIQAFFNISVIEVAPLFFITLGLCNDKENAVK